MIKKIFLIQPPAFANPEKGDINPNVPLGIAYIAAVLEKKGYQVKMLDAFVEGWENEEYINDETIRVGLSFEEIEEIIADFSPDLVGVSNLFTMQRKNAHRICEIVKKINPRTIVLMGGAHPTVAPELVLENNNVDFVVIGEGEETLVELIKVIENKRSFGSLDGVAFRKNGKVVVLPKTKFIEDLDSIPFPARHLLPMETYFSILVTHGGIKKTPYASIVTSRGCPAKCTFCSAYKVWGRKYRVRSPENVIAEIRHLIDKYKIKELLFEDDNLTMNTRRAEEIFDRMIEEKFDLIWNTPNGVAAFSLNKRIIKKMKESGCYQLNFALESGNQYVLDNVIKKPLKLNKMLSLVNYAREIGLEVGAFFVVGMPGETKEQIRDSFRLAKKWKFYAPFISIATPYPGTEIYEICKEKGYLFKDYNLDNLVIFKHSFETPQWTAQELDDLIERERLILRLHFYIRHPVLLLKRFLSKLIYHPKELFLKLFKIFKYLIT